MANHTAMHDIVGVFRTETTANDVARRVRELGVPMTSVRVGDAATRVEAMKAEMREEADNTIVGPGNVGPFTKEMTKSLVPQTIAWSCALAVVGLVLALFEWPASDLTFAQRLPIAAVVGAFAGATIGFVWGGGRGAAREPSLDGLAAERGVSVSASVADAVAPRVVEVMRAAEPIRLDLGTLEGQPVDTITTEADADAEEDSRRS